MPSPLLQALPPLSLRLREATRPLPVVRPRGVQAPRVEAARFACERIMSGGIAAVSIEAPGVDPASVWCTPSSTGFLVDALPERAIMGDQVVLGLRIYRRIGTPSPRCVVRIGVGDHSVSAFVDVHHH